MLAPIYFLKNYILGYKKHTTTICGKLRKNTLFLMKKCHFTEKSY